MYRRLILSLLAVLVLACPAAAQTRPKARPSLDGLWRVNFILTMEGSPNVPLVVSEEAAPAIAKAQGAALAADFIADLDPEFPMLVEVADGLPIVRGQRRSRVLVQPADGKLPYTASALKELAPPPPGTPPPASRLDNPEQRPNAERCLVGDGQPPYVNFSLDRQLQIVVTEGHVALHGEYGDDVRIVPLTETHRPRALWSRLGDSIGRWEGDTLVVETVGMPDADRVRFAPTLIVSGEAKVIERFTAISQRELLYQFTIVDPKTFSGPWLAEFSWFRTDKPMYEHACHEGNYSLPNILAGARYEEAQVAKAAAAAP